MTKSINVWKAFVLGVSLLVGGNSYVSLGYSHDARTSQDAAPNASKSATLLRASDLAKLLPTSVYFKGQSAPTQGRNSGGVHFADDTYMFVALVDSSGYSTGVQEKYQAYLITDVPILFDGHILPSGAYGFGFRSGDIFVVMDLGGNDILTAHTQHDAVMHRPTPLQVLAGEAPGSFRIYEGRSSVTFTRAPGESK